MRLQAILAIMFDLTMVASGLLAVLRGSGPELTGAVVNIAGAVATGLCILLGLAHWGPGSLATWLIDLCVLSSFYLLSVKSARFWPIWSFGFALSDISLHLAAALLPRFAFAYASGQVVFAYLALFVLAVAVLRLPPSERRQWSAGWRDDRARASGGAR